MQDTEQNITEAERARLGIRPDPRPNLGLERQTHGRHCLCTPCCLQDWSEPELAPCGMHGSACPPVYDPYERAARVIENLAPSVAVLREHGPLDLREITRYTAKRLGMSVMYEDVDAVLQRECEDGHVVLVVDAGDYRNRIWEASPVSVRSTG